MGAEDGVELILGVEAHFPLGPARELVGPGDLRPAWRVCPHEHLPGTREHTRELLDRPVHPTTAEPGAAPQPTGIGRVESPRGATTCVVELTAGQVRRLRLRTGSYANWPSVAYAAAGNLLPDFPLINKSFELCYACVDR